MAWRGFLSVAAVLLAELLAGGDAAAGAWTRAEGEGFAAQSVRYFSTDVSTSSSVDFAKASLGLYVEYGLSDVVTIGADLDQGLRLDDVGYGAQDGWIGGFLRARLAKGESDVFSVEIGGDWPLSDLASPAAPGGDDSKEIRALALYGRGVETPLGLGWIDGAFGFAKFIGDRADEIRLDLTFGARPDEDWVLMTQVFGTYGLRNAAFGGVDFDLLKAQVSVGRRIFGEKTLLIGVARDVLTRGISPGYEVSVTLWSLF